MKPGTVPFWGFLPSEIMIHCYTLDILEGILILKSNRNLIILLYPNYRGIFVNRDKDINIQWMKEWQRFLNNNRNSFPSVVYFKKYISS